MIPTTHRLLPRWPWMASADFPGLLPQSHNVRRGREVEDLRAQPVAWDIAFETTGEMWLGITIPFVGDTAKEAVVDT